MKKVLLVSIILIAVALIVLLISEFSTTRVPGEPLNAVSPDSAQGVTKTGTVIAVDQSQMIFDGPILISAVDEMGQPFTIAVPTMGINVCAAKAAIADINLMSPGDTVTVSGDEDESGNIVPCARPDQSLEVFGVGGDPAYEFAFLYRKGPNGYTVLEEAESTHPDFVFGTTLMNTVEYEALMNSTDAREGPPAMQVRVYENTGKQFAAVWADANTTETNRTLTLGQVAEVVVGGANAVQFVTDGLYPTNTYVVAHGQYVYVLTGSYLDTDSDIYRDFELLVSSVTFVPPQTGGVSGKINPAVVCENALAYMSFVDAAAAEAFVAECTNGEHPEVIERYISEQGLDGATI